MSPLGFGSAKKDKKEKAAKAPKAPKAPKAAKAKAPPAAARGVVVEKPPANIYTVLLAMSFVAVLIGCIFLSLEMSAYDWDFKGR
ncbi:MAG: hypothetical protein WD845_08635 [Pirellulales bacterium]